MIYKCPEEIEALHSGATHLPDTKLSSSFLSLGFRVPVELSSCKQQNTKDMDYVHLFVLIV